MSVIEAVVRNHKGFLSSCFLRPGEALLEAEVPGQTQGQDLGVPQPLGSVLSWGLPTGHWGPLAPLRPFSGTLGKDVTMTHLEAS